MGGKFKFSKADRQWRKSGCRAFGTFSLFKRRQANGSERGLPALLAGLKTRDTDQKKIGNWGRILT
jgi:hypothetical protein